MKDFLKEFYNGCIPTKKTTNQSRGLFIRGCDLASRQRWSFCYARLWNSYKGCPQKTHFLNCRFGKPDLRVYGLPLPVGWKAIYPQTYFLNSRNSESAFFGQTIWCSIAIVQSAIPWLAETMFALLVP